MDPTIYSDIYYILGDGTFRITPSLWYQTFILHASVGRSAVPVLFALLPDKQKRSYSDMFSCLKRALEERELELSAQTFMSDFEHNIRSTFNEYFPEVQPQGCYFHYGKAIWARVKKNGMASYYSKNGLEPKFGSFVRLIIGLPSVKVDDIHRGLKNIEKVGSQFKHKKCREFATSMLSYLEKFWMSLPLELWNVFNVKDRTNNLAEGYNFALGSKKIISKHPNPYTLVSVIKDELNIASDNALTIVMSKPKRCTAKKYTKLENRRKELMRNYDRGNMELFIYQVTVGNAYLNNFNRITEDCDPDPYGTGKDKTVDENEDELFLDKSYCEDQDIESEEQELVELTFQNNLCINIKERLVEDKKGTKAKKIPKNGKRQKPIPNIRKSTVFQPIFEQLEISESSAAGQDLREKRKKIDLEENISAPILLAAVAAAAVTSVLAPGPEADQRPADR